MHLTSIQTVDNTLSCAPLTTPLQSLGPENHTKIPFYLQMKNWAEIDI